MKEENKITSITKAFFKLFTKKDKQDEKRVSDEAKREMCRRAMQSGVCPHACERCAWNRFEVE